MNTFYICALYRELDLNCAVIVSVEGNTTCVANSRVLLLFLCTELKFFFN